MNPYVQYMYSYPHKTAYRPLHGIFLEQYLHYLQGSGNGLYLHIPFCQAKCGYCNLFSVTGQKKSDVERYLDAVKRQSMQYKELLQAVQAEFSELAIGGGTPLYLTAGQLDRMFGILRGNFRFASQCAVAVETAPNQTDAQKLGILKQAGVTRVSMGIQSFHDSELRSLGRQHRAKKAREALHLIKTAEFACVNVDFIYGILGQTVESLLASLQEALTFEPDEIFLYPLYVNHGAWLKRYGTVQDPGGAFLQYQQASAFLKSAGYCQDSMRRFVRRQGARAYRECGFGTSLALGCGGRSYLGGLHFCSPYAVEKAQCLARLAEYEKTEDYTKVTHGILLSEEERKRRYVIRHLLIMPGLSLEGYQQAFQSAAMEEFPILREWMDKGFARLEVQEGGSSNYLTLTQEGLGLSDYLGPMLISAQVHGAMEAWEAEYGRA